jgi:hypothetical protein
MHVRIFAVVAVAAPEWVMPEIPGDRVTFSDRSVAFPTQF